ncbi:MAG: pseudouridine synthase [Burkholderiales bacterium]|jgi:23S rRNA pseudouridine2604 synthase
MSDTKKPAPKATLTIKRKPAEGESASQRRSYSTRAKAAARRDGRELPFIQAATPTSPVPAADTAAGKKPRAKSDGRPPRARDDARPPRSRDEGRPPSEGRAKPAGEKPAFGARRAAAAPTTPATSREGSRDASRGERPRQERTLGRDASSGGVATEPRRSPPKRDDIRRHNRAGDGRSSRSSTEVSAERVEKPKGPTPPPREPDGLVRVSKLLSEQGLCSRREADSYIARGWVYADGVRITELGTRVLPTAKLKLDQQAAAMQESRVTVLLHKPVGYVSGQAEDGYEPASVLVTAEHQLPSDPQKLRPEIRRGLAPAGRLDIDSTGLLVLTQDGRVAKQLIGEDSEVEKEYLVRVEGTLTPEALASLNHGLELDGEALKPARVKWQNADQLNFILKEGKKRQIRRMCEMVGLKVVGLKRIRIGKVMLGDLPMGKWRYLRDDESFA